MPEEIKRYELKVYTNYTSMEGLSTPVDYLEKGRLIGLSGIAVTDRQTICGLSRWYDVGQNRDFKCMCGVELVAENDLFPKSFHKRFCVSVLAKDATGLHQIYRIITQMEKNGKRSSVSLQYLLDHREHLLLGSCCEEGVFFHHSSEEIRSEDFFNAAEIFDYLEICPTMEDDIVQIIAALGENLNIPVAAVSDARYCYKAQSAHYYSICCANALKDVTVKEKQLYSAAQLMRRFAFLGEEQCHAVVYDNTVLIANQITEFPLLPQEILSITPQADPILSKIQQQLTLNYTQNPPEFVKERLNEEITFFNREGLMGHLQTFSGIMQNITDGYACGGYGASFVAYLLGISHINPLPKHIRCRTCGCITLCDGQETVDFNGDLICPECGEECTAEGFDLSFLYFANSTEQNQLQVISAPQQLHKVQKQLLSMFHPDNIALIGTFRTMPYARFRQFYAQLSNDHPNTLPALPTEQSFDKLTSLGGGISHSSGDLTEYLIVPQQYCVSDFTALCAESTEKIDTFLTAYSIEDFENSGLTVVKLISNTTLQQLFALKASSKAVISAQDNYIAETMHYLRMINQEEIRWLPEEYLGYLMHLAAYFPLETFENLVDIFSIGHGSKLWVNNFDHLVDEKIVTPDEVFTSCDDLLNLFLTAGMDLKTATLLVNAAHCGNAKSVMDTQMLEYFAQLNLPEWLPIVLATIKRIHAKAYAVAEADVFCQLIWYRLHDPELYQKICLKG